MITQSNIGQKVYCLTDHNGYRKGRVYKCTWGMAFSAPVNWEVFKNTKLTHK